MLPRQNAPHDSFGQIATIRMEIADTDPLIWRQVEVPTSITLKVLHDIVQASFGWFDCHLWEFIIGGKKYGLPMDDGGDGVSPKLAHGVRLRDVLLPDKTVIGYTYDFGDSWRHNLLVTDVRQGNLDTSYPRYVGGECNGPPEDCGGAAGFYEKLEARTDPSDPEHEEIANWFGDYDLQKLDELPIKHALGRIAARRNAAKARLSKTL